MEKKKNLYRKYHLFLPGLHPLYFTPIKLLNQTLLEKIIRIEGKLLKIKRMFIITVKLKQKK